MSDDLAKRLISRFERLQADRGTWEATWQEIVDYFLPNHTPITSVNTPGTRYGTKIYDDQPARDVLKLASTLNAMIANQASQWFAFETLDKELMRSSDHKQYFDLVDTTLRNELDNSNFSTQIHETCIDAVSLCTATMFVEQSAQQGRVLQFSARPLRECYLSEDHEGYIDTIFRLIDTLTARQIVQRFTDLPGAAIPEAVRQKADRPAEQDQACTLIHAVYPRTERDTSSRAAVDFPYASVWIHRDSARVVYESGYQEMPAGVLRWHTCAGEIYGRGPCLVALGDAKTLQNMNRTLLRVGEKMADPPLQVPSEGFLGKYSLKPGALNYFNPTSSGRVEPIKIDGNIPIAVELLQDRRDAIREALMVNQLQVIDRKQMTAEEVRERISENIRILGPIFGRWQAEFLDRILLRCYRLCRRAGLIPDPPAALRDAPVKVKYLSPLAKSQQYHEVQAVQLTVGTAIRWASELQQPDLLDNLDLDKAVRLVADLDGAPGQVLRDEKQVAALRQARAEQQQRITQIQAQAAQAQTADKVAGAAQKLALIQGGR